MRPTIRDWLLEDLIVPESGGKSQFLSDFLDEYVVKQPRGFPELAQWFGVCCGNKTNSTML